MQSGFKLMAREVTDLFTLSGYQTRLTFEFLDSPDFGAWSDSVGDEYIIGMNLGLYKRLSAIFRQLTLTNAFGKYKQTTRFERDDLATLYAVPGIHQVRAREESIPINALLNAPGYSKFDQQELDSYLALPPVDHKHKFDIQSLVVPAMSFTFWHELAHILMGHIRWQKLEENTNEQLQNGLEYIADEFAARRIAYDILQSATREIGSYVLGPFWLNRSGFEAVGQLEGMPGEDIQFNLEGFMYRIAFAIQILVYHFRGFFSEPVTHKKRSHPHPELRLSRIIDIVDYHIRTAPFDPGVQGYLAKIWNTMYGYAMFTAEMALSSCNSQQLPLQRDGRQTGNMFHAFDIQSRVKASNRIVQSAYDSIAGYEYAEILKHLEPAGGSLQFPMDRRGMIEIVDDFPRIFEREV
jgi:hypothetical protein